MKNVTATGNVHINIETLKAREDTTSKTLAKLYTKCLSTSHEIEQPGFKSGYSTTDHIHVVNQLKEKCREYYIPFCIAFVDYEKAFDLVQTQAVLILLKNRG